MCSSDLRELGFDKLGICFVCAQRKPDNGADFDVAARKRLPGERNPARINTDRSKTEFARFRAKAADIILRGFRLEQGVIDE